MGTNKQDDPIYVKECYDESLVSNPNLPAFCPFSIPSGQYAWINESIPFVVDTDPNVKTSQFKDKMTSAYCKNSSALA